MVLREKTVLQQMVTGAMVYEALPEVFLRGHFEQHDSLAVIEARQHMIQATKGRNGEQIITHGNGLVCQCGGMTHGTDSAHDTTRIITQMRAQMPIAAIEQRVTKTQIGDISAFLQKPRKIFPMMTIARHARLFFLMQWQHARMQFSTLRHEGASQLQCARVTIMVTGGIGNDGMARQQLTRGMSHLLGGNAHTHAIKSSCG